MYRQGTFVSYKKVMKKVLTVLLTLLLSCCLFGCGSSNGGDNQETGNSDDLSGQTLKIGYFGLLTNSDNIMNVDIINMFIDKWNKEGTLYNANVELIKYDNANNGEQDTEMSIKCAQKLIYNDGVQIIIPAQLSNIIQATGEIINEANILDIGLGLSPTWMEQGWDYVYRPALNNNYQVPSFTKTMLELGQKNISLIYQNTDNCLTFRDSFKKAAEEANLNIVSEQMTEYNGGAGITGQITSAVNANPDCIFITAMGLEFGTMIKQIRQAGYKGMIYIGQPLTTSEVDSIGDEEVNGVVFCAPYIVYETLEDCDNDLQKGLLQQYKDAYGALPPNDMFYKTCDAMLLIEKAVLAAKSLDPQKLQAVISTLKFEGCGGTMDFTTGSNECYFSARPWVYTGQGNGGKPVLLNSWLETDLAKAINLKAE